MSPAMALGGQHQQGPQAVRHHRRGGTVPPQRGGQQGDRVGVQVTESLTGP